MESLKDIALRQQESGPRYFEDPGQERLFKLVLELAEEVCVLRDRLETADTLAALGQDCSAVAIDEYEVSSTEIEKRLAQHQAFYEGLFNKLQP